MATYADRREVYDDAIRRSFGQGVQGRSGTGTSQPATTTASPLRSTARPQPIWWHEEGEILWHKPMGKPAIRLARGDDGMAADAEAATRIREGHPEGYLLAFANLYQLFAQAIMARELGRPHERFIASLPTVEEGVKGISFIEAATRSNDEGGAWVKVLRDADRSSRWDGDSKMATIDSVTFRACAVGGQATLNGWCSIPERTVAEIMALQPWETMTVDLQHGLLDFQRALDLIRTIEGHGK